MIIFFLLIISCSACGFFDAFRAENLFRQKRYDESYEINKKNGIEHPGEPTWWYNAGQAAFEQQEYEKAREAFTNAAVASTDLQMKKKSLFNAGSSSALLKEYPDALKTFEKLLEADPSDQQIRERYNLLKQLVEQQQSDQQNSENDQKKNPDAQNDKKDSQNQEQQNDSSDESEQEDKTERPADSSGNSEKKSGDEQSGESKSGDMKKENAGPEKKEKKQGQKDEDKKDDAQQGVKRQDGAEQKKEEQKESGRFAQLDEALQSLEEGSHTQLQQYVQEQTTAGTTTQW
jgi:Ca-activated chloride channel homolog